MDYPLDAKIIKNRFSYLHICFYIFVITHLFLWTLIPALVRKNLPLDVIEGIAWGSQWQWGYYKHPFLAPWLTQIGALLSPHSGWVIYLLSQLCISTCFFSIWRLTLKFSTPLKALFSVLLLEGVVYYTLTADEFNNGLVMIATWSLAYLAFYNAVNKQRWIDWLLTGLFCGLALVSKYYSVVLILSMFAFLIFNKNARKSFANIYLYFGLICFFIIIIPNMLWLYQHHFIAIHYAFNRAHTSHTALNHLTGITTFLIGQFTNILFALLIFFFVLFPKQKFGAVIKNYNDRQLINFLFWGPIVITLLFPLITGDHLMDLWGEPLFSLLGVVLVHSLSSVNLEQRLKPFLIVVYGVMAVLLIFFSLSIIWAPYLKNRGSREYFPGHDLGLQVTQLWKKKYARKLDYVVGDTWLAGNVGFYSTQKPFILLDANFIESPWITQAQLQQKGAVVVWAQTEKNCTIPNDVQKKFPAINCQMTLSIPYQGTASQYKINVGVGFIAPKSANN